MSPLQPELRKRAVRLLFEPGARLKDSELRATARLLAGALLAAFVLFGIYDSYLIGARPGYVPPWPGYLLMALAYALVRAGYYMAAVLPTLAMFPLVAFALVVSGRAPTPIATLTFPLISVLLATLLLGSRGTAVIALGSATLAALTTVVGRHPLPWTSVAGPLLINLVGGAIGVLSIVHRQRIERERRQALEANTRELERLVAERTAALEHTVAELESFSYSVSHDLRAPLRAVAGFSAILLEDHGEQLGEEGRELVSVIRRSGERMSQLIDGLLKLSQVTRMPLARRRVDLGLMAREIVEALRVGDPARKVEIVIPAELGIMGDEALVRAILENMLGNAWKFTKHCDPARIELLRAERGGRSWVAIRDNGPGFDAAYAGQLFQAFQRLHPESDFPGTGIGLATVQRAVTRHGGEVFAESTPGNGATFGFHLGAES